MEKSSIRGVTMTLGEARRLIDLLGEEQRPLQEAIREAFKMLENKEAVSVSVKLWIGD